MRNEGYVQIFVKVSSNYILALLGTTTTTAQTEFSSKDFQTSKNKFLSQ